MGNEYNGHNGRDGNQQDKRKKSSQINPSLKSIPPGGFSLLPDSDEESDNADDESSDNESDSDNEKNSDDDASDKSDNDEDKNAQRESDDEEAPADDIKASDVEEELVEKLASATTQGTVFGSAAETEEERKVRFNLFMFYLFQFFYVNKVWC